MDHPDQIGEYRILELIARGGMAEIYLARHPDTHDKDLALKVIRTEFAGDTTVRDMFVSEARVALALSHANVVQTFEVAPYGDSIVLAMEHVDGMDVARLLHTHEAQFGERLPLRHAVLIAADALSGLDYAHRCRGPDGQHLGLVHRDVSSGNLLVSCSGDVKVADFGVAISNVRHHQSIDGTLKGKLAYMSPEQARAAKLDPRTDVYSMGVVLYELCTGKRPFAGTSPAIIPDLVTGRFVRPSELRADLPTRLEEIILTAMANDREARFDSAGEMSEALRDFAFEHGLVLSHLGLGELVTRLVRRARTTIPPGGPSLEMTRRETPMAKRDEDE
ncbi:MAG: serine/threonine-protein kinase [Sandaracinaceae bacterium]